MAGLAFPDKSCFYKLQCSEKSPTAPESSAFQRLSVLIAWFAEGKSTVIISFHPFLLQMVSQKLSNKKVLKFFLRHKLFSIPFASYKQVHIAMIMIQL